GAFHQPHILVGDGSLGGRRRERERKEEQTVAQHMSHHSDYSGPFLSRDSNAAVLGRMRNSIMRFCRLTIFSCLFGATAQQPGSIAIDVQEWRESPAKHFYIHGILNGDTAFHVFLPAREAWKGRLLQYLQGGLGGSEKEGVRMGQHAYALANGAVYVESSP